MLLSLIFNCLRNPITPESTYHLSSRRKREWLCLGCISEFWRGPHQAVFVLRQAQHERTILNKFNPSPVRPELVEGGTAGSQRALTELPEN